MSLDLSRALPALKPFSLTHILYDPAHPLSIPFTLLSLSPIFLFVSYFTLLIFTRRLTILLLGLGSIANEILSLLLKSWWKGDRPYKGLLELGDIGEGYGMPSSHAQAAGFLVAWGIGYTLGQKKRQEKETIYSGPTTSSHGGSDRVRRFRTSIYLFGLILWSLLVAYSRYHLHYHSLYQIAVGYLIGLASGSVYFLITEHIPLYHPESIPGRLRTLLELLWTTIGGVGGWRLGDAPGGWLESESRDDQLRRTLRGTSGHLTKELLDEKRM